MNIKQLKRADRVSLAPAVKRQRSTMSAVCLLALALFAMSAVSAERRVVQAQEQAPDPALLSRYATAIQEAVINKWIRPDNAEPGQRCRVSVQQIPGGEVLSVKADPSCAYDDMGRRSIEDAVWKANPLPYAGFETVFERSVIFNFEAH